MDFWSAFAEKFLLEVAPVLGVFVAAALTALARKWWAEGKAAAPEVMYQLEWVAGVAVKAAEQAGIKEEIDDKKAYAIGIVQDYLNSKGLKINVAMIEAAIQAAVFEEFDRDKAAPMGLPEVAK